MEQLIKSEEFRKIMKNKQNRKNNCDSWRID
jgi:hypothetical protein